MQKPKILIIDNSRFPTGAFTSIYLLSSAIHDFEFHFSIPSDSLLVGKLNKDGIRVYPLPYLELSKSFRSIFYLPVLIVNSFRLLRYIRKHRISVVHVNDVYNLCGVVLKFLNPDLHLIYHVRLLPDSYIRNLYSLYVFFVKKFADEVIAVSEAVQSTLKNRYNLNSQLIYGFIRAADYNQPDDKPKRSGHITLLYLANYTKGKGHEFAIRAVLKAHEKIKNLKMIMAGGVFDSDKNLKFKKYLEEMVRSNGAEGYIHLHEFVEDAQQLIKACDIFLNFSESESFSRTCLEAMTCGRPVIATECGGPGEMVIHGKTGLLVPVGNTDAMAEAIVQLATHEELRLQLAAEGQKYVMKKFEPEQSIQKMRNIYSSLLGHPVKSEVTIGGKI